MGGSWAEAGAGAGVNGVGRGKVGDWAAHSGVLGGSCHYAHPGGGMGGT